MWCSKLQIHARVLGKREFSRESGLPRASDRPRHCIRMDSTMQRSVSILVLVVSCGCQTLSPPRMRAASYEEMASAVSQGVPAGTPLADARKTMEAAGFECDLMTNASFSEDPGIIGSNREEFRSVQDARYLSCEKTESAGFLVSHIWTVALVADDANNVQDVLVLHRMEGL